MYIMYHICIHIHTHIIQYSQSKVTSLCNEKTEWLDKNLEANESEIIEQIEDFNERYQTHLSKLDTRQD